MMDIVTARNILERHNRWRRGGDDTPMTEPYLLGQAIDKVVEYIDEQLKDKK